jgi:hypothetical protein
MSKSPSFLAEIQQMAFISYVPQCIIKRKLSGDKNLVVAVVFFYYWHTSYLTTSSHVVVVAAAVAAVANVPVRLGPLQFPPTLYSSHPTADVAASR